ncbi:hypothetical protein [Flagellimonas sp. 2504JD4-2]
MTRAERLEFCTICTNRKKDFQKGLLCGLTNDYAEFENTCDSFDEDVTEKNIKLLRDLNASGHQSAGKSLDPDRNKQNGALCFVIGIIILFVTISYSNISGILIIPFGAIIYGGRTYLKGVEQSKILDKYEEFEDE